MPRWPSAETRFLSYIQRSEGCWIWKGPFDSHGYGQLWWDGRLELASRVALRLSGHNFSFGECALHSCDNPPCVRVDKEHLHVGTKLTNSNEMKARGRERKAYGERHHNAKLSESDVIAIRGSNVKVSDLAKIYNVDRTHIYLIRRGKLWAHIPMKSVTTTPVFFK